MLRKFVKDILGHVWRRSRSGGAIRSRPDPTDDLHAGIQDEIWERSQMYAEARGKPVMAPLVFNAMRDLAATRERVGSAQDKEATQ